MKPLSRPEMPHDHTYVRNCADQVGSSFRSLALLLVATVILTSASSVIGQQSRANPPHSRKISKDFEGRNAGETVDVIVQFNQPPTEKHHQKVKAKGGAWKENLNLVNGGVYSLPASALEDLASDPDVAYISPDRPVSQMNDVSRPTIGADIARGLGWDGTGIGVAVIDSGVSLPPDLNNGHVAYEESFIPYPAGEIYGHGNHVAGIIAGRGKDSSGKYAGIAPGAKIINLRVLDDNGIGTDSNVIKAINRAIQLKNTYNIRVMNLSLGRPVKESYTLDPLCQAVEQAWKAGIVVVVAAGNQGRNNSLGTYGYRTIGSPAIDPYVITVGAMKTMGTPYKADDQIASYSSKGPTMLDHIVKPDVVAPGNRVVSVSTNGVSLLEKNYPTNMVGAAYFKLSGTSMAAPMVSGAAALLLQKTPSLTPDQVKARLMKTASKAFPTMSAATDPVTGQNYTSQYDIFTVGAGYVDIVAALNNTDVFTGDALSPKVVYDPTSQHAYLQHGAVSGNTIVWDDAIVWGDTIVWSDTVIWGDTVVWSDAVSGSTVI